MQGVCLEVTKPLPAVSQGRIAAHPSSPAVQRLQFMASEGSRAVPELHPALQGLPRLWVGSCSPRAAPWLSASMARSPCSATERKSCFISAQLLHVPTSLFTGTEPQQVTSRPCHYLA